MSFASALRPGRLPEKPWQTSDVWRLLGCVFIGMLMGGAVATTIRYFETTETSSPAKFLVIVIAAFACYSAAIVMLSRPWSAEPDIAKLIVLIALLHGGVLLTSAAGKMIKGDVELKNPIITIVIAVLAFQGLALVLVHFFLRRHLTNWIEGFGLNIHPGQSLLIGIGVGVLVVYPVLLLNDLCFQLFERLTLHPQVQPAVEILRHTETLFSRAVSGVATVFLAPIGEEVVFRGILYPWAKRRISPAIALWGTAIVFGAIHFNLSSFIPLTILALILVWLYEFTGNLLAPIAVHVVFNGTNFIALFFQQK